MKTGLTESEKSKEPPERDCTLLRDVGSCRHWIMQNGKKDHLYKIYQNKSLSERWHFHNNNWMKAIREHLDMRRTLE